MGKRNKYLELRDGLEKNIPSQFVKYDTFTGGTVSPDSDVFIEPRSNSVFDEDYYWGVATRLGFVIARCCKGTLVRPKCKKRNKHR